LEGYFCELVVIDLLLQVGSALEYLHNLGIIHGDLASRNVLISSHTSEEMQHIIFDNGSVAFPEIQLKLIDFGLSMRLESERSHYTLDDNREYDFRSCPPECLLNVSPFCYTKSDVWTFGVLIWEIITLVGSPFCNINTSQCLFDSIREGLRLPLDPHLVAIRISPNLESLIQSCWEFELENRPTMIEIVSFLCMLQNTK
jgi:serine/threonine protein kinase